MEYTQHYQLPLWDKEDAIKRTDFNENNQKINAAIAAAAASVSDLIVTGTYKGTTTTAEPTVTQTISLGFQPRFLLVRSVGYKGSTYSGDTGWDTENIGFATPTHGHYIYGDDQVIQITEDGFIAGGTSAKFNNSGSTYAYLAIR